MKKNILILLILTLILYGCSSTPNYNEVSYDYMVNPDTGARVGDTYGEPITLDKPHYQVVDKETMGSDEIVSGDYILEGSYLLEGVSPFGYVAYSTYNASEDTQLGIMVQGAKVYFTNPTDFGEKYHGYDGVSALENKEMTVAKNNDIWIEGSPVTITPLVVEDENTVHIYEYYNVVEDKDGNQSEVCYKAEEGATKEEVPCSEIMSYDMLKSQWETKNQ